MIERSWYLIYCKPKQEQVAKENLERQHYESFLPMIRARRRRSGAYHTVIEPLFPRYLFIALSSEVDDWGPIRSTRGVASLVRFGGVPAKVPDRLVEFIKNQDIERTREEVIVNDLTSGDRVRILDGAWDGYEAIFEAHSSKERVSLLLDILGQPTRITLSSDLVEKF